AAESAVPSEPRTRAAGRDERERWALGRGGQVKAASRATDLDPVASWQTAAISSRANGEGEMRCTTCGRENPTDARFCNSCGQTLLTAEAREAPEVAPNLPSSIAAG